MILVDANVLSEVTKSEPSEAVLAWLVRHERELVVDPLILGEIRFGILLLPEGARRKRLDRWYEGTVERIHCLPWDATHGVRWADLLAELRGRGQVMPIKDSLIAATALTHGIPLATRNRRDFEKAGVELVDPFDANAL